MKFENRAPAEGINAEPESLSREAFWLVAGSVLALVVLVASFDVLARWLAPRLPFSVELKLADSMDRSGPAPAPELRAAQADLQALALRLRGPMGLPDDMPVQIRLDPGNTVNAYATLGGRIVVYRGLLDRLQSEDELLALLAHEMAHVQHRDVATSMGRGLALGLLLSLVSSDLGGQVAAQILGDASGLMMLSYGREHERQADQAAMQAVAGLQGHVGGVKRLFARLALVCQPPAGPAAAGRADGAPPGRQERQEPPEWLSSHPLQAQRAATTQAWARSSGVALDGPPAPLSAALRAVQQPTGPCVAG